MVAPDERPDGLTGSDLVIRVTRDPDGVSELIRLEGSEPVSDQRFELDPDLFLCAQTVQKECAQECWDLGAWLWEALPEKIRSALEKALEEPPVGDRQRLVLWFDEDCASRFLPWELLRFGKHLFPQATKRLAVVRYVPRVPIHTKRRGVDSGSRVKLKVLVLIGDQQQPWQTQSADADAVDAVWEIVQAISDPVSLCELKIAGPSRVISRLGGAAIPVHQVSSVDEVADVIRDFDADVLIFLGHSDGHDPVDPLERLATPAGTTAIRFRFESGPRSLPVELPITDLADMVRDGRCRLIMLGACLIQDHVARDLLGSVDHVVATGGRPTPEFVAALVKSFVRPVLSTRLTTSVGGAMVVVRSRLFRRQERHEFWLPIYWTSSLDDQPLIDDGLRSAVVLEAASRWSLIAGYLSSGSRLAVGAAALATAILWYTSEGWAFVWVPLVGFAIMLILFRELVRRRAPASGRVAGFLKMSGSASYWLRMISTQRNLNQSFWLRGLLHSLHRRLLKVPHGSRSSLPRLWWRPKMSKIVPATHMLLVVVLASPWQHGFAEVLPPHGTPAFLGGTSRYSQYDVRSATVTRLWAAVSADSQPNGGSALEATILSSGWIELRVDHKPRTARVLRVNAGPDCTVSTTSEFNSGGRVIDVPIVDGRARFHYFLDLEKWMTDMQIAVVANDGSYLQEGLLRCRPPRIEQTLRRRIP